MPQPRCVNAHDRCYLGGPCPYCEIKMTTPPPLAPQARLVLEYLQSGRQITPLLAITNLGVASLTTRISELRKAGFQILSEWSEDHFKRRYKKYWMTP